MSHRQRLTAEKIAQRLRLIRPLIAKQRRPIDRFRLEELPDATVAPHLSVSAREAPGEILDWQSYWGGQNLHFVLRSQFAVPADWQDAALHFPLGVAGDIFTHPEGLLHIDGTTIASADRYHHTIEIPRRFVDGQSHEVLLHGWTGLTSWPPDPRDRSQLFLRECAVIDVDCDLQDLIMLAETALDLSAQMNDNRPEKHAILSALDSAFLVLDTRDPMEDAFRASILPATQKLKEGLSRAGPPLDVTLHAAGHAHMDVAYLWPTAQIRQKNARTYSNVLRLMEKYDAFHFSHSQPQLYAWTQEDYPEIFEGIRKRVAEGRWEILGGMWVEPDANMPGAEALVRQLLLARRYCDETFGPGAEAPVLWLPDTFGFPACLPQLMVQAGLRWFVTNKVNWNQYNQMPASTTWWEGIDGSRVLAQFLTTPRTVQHLPFPTNYKSDLTAGEVVGTWSRNTMKDRVRELLIAYGYGDGGGGPTDELIRRAKSYEMMPGAPRVVQSTVRRYFERLEEEAPALPTWQGEFYLEGHRGVLTGNGWIKRANRKTEVLLHDAELAMSLAMMGGREPEDLTEEWRLLCMMQFHDILTGTSVPVVFEDARRDFARITQSVEAVLDRAAKAIAPQDAAYLVLDTAPLPGARLVKLPNGAGPVAEAGGGSLPMQSIEDGVLVELPAGVPLSTRPLYPSSGPATEPQGATAMRTPDGGAILENAVLRVTFGDHGMITSILDKRRGREVLKDGALGNKLELFEDRPISWDAWDIDIFFEDRGEVVTALNEMDVVETGPLRATIQLTRAFRQSRLTQRISLTRHSARIDFDTDVDWHETHLLLKAAFPVSVRASRAEFDIQWGQIDRPGHRNTSWDAAQFEVPAQKWADLSEGDYGVALLNDCKYGYDVRGDVLRLSLIKSATMPDNTADQGHHRFTYALLPHEGDTRVDVRREAYALNLQPRVYAGSGDGAGSRGSIVECESQRIVIETIKPAEDGEGIIVRLYEAHNTNGPVTLRFDPAVRSVERCGLLETESEPITLTKGEAAVSLRNYEILTLRLRL
ncbi:alpha-mannosidase [Jannaschia aquimarina]|uniref:Alpha-mannosidase n=1 Tax=Jannaschia aquimarina TaxID=935700 RepID=A0A0D1EH93_9RHOB|nr:glycoside hydrolase family 38 C-terminal domain-containing protein [Jannaschia aquimarina]KIT17044.1 alpha-mannosidase [Jannaschia aquimarina]SNS82148.1 alpha-mannosidase [Jannaschia aquimarina]